MYTLGTVGVPNRYFIKISRHRGLSSSFMDISRRVIFQLCPFSCVFISTVWIFNSLEVPRSFVERSRRIQLECSIQFQKYFEYLKRPSQQVLYYFRSIQNIQNLEYLEGSRISRRIQNIQKDLEYLEGSRISRRIQNIQKDLEYIEISRISRMIQLEGSILFQKYLEYLEHLEYLEGSRISRRIQNIWKCKREHLKFCFNEFI